MTRPKRKLSHGTIKYFLLKMKPVENFEVNY